MKNKIFKKIFKTEEKKILIEKHVKDYQTPIKINTKLNYVPTDKDVSDYLELLKKLSYKELKLINEPQNVIKRSTLMMKIKSKLSPKNALMITIHQLNQKRSHYIISKYSRFAKVNGRAYVIVPNYTTYDSLYNIPLLEYFENNPLPIEFIDDKIQSIPEAGYLNDALHFEYGTKMAKIAEFMKKTNLAVVMSGLAFATSSICLICLIVLLRHFQVV